MAPFPDAVDRSLRVRGSDAAAVQRVCRPAPAGIRSVTATILADELGGVELSLSLGSGLTLVLADSGRATLRAAGPTAQTDAALVPNRWFRLQLGLDENNRSAHAAVEPVLTGASSSVATVDLPPGATDQNQPSEICLSGPVDSNRHLYVDELVLSSAAVTAPH